MGFVDSDFPTNVNFRKSQTGYMFNMFGSTINGNLLYNL